MPFGRFLCNGAEQEHAGTQAQSKGLPWLGCEPGHQVQQAQQCQGARDHVQNRTQVSKREVQGILSHTCRVYTSLSAQQAASPLPQHSQLGRLPLPPTPNSRILGTATPDEAIAISLAVWGNPIELRVRA